MLISLGAHEKIFPENIISCANSEKSLVVLSMLLFMGFEGHLKGHQASEYSCLQSLTYDNLQPSLIVLWGHKVQWCQNDCHCILWRQSSGQSLLKGREHFVPLSQVEHILGDEPAI